MHKLVVCIFIVLTTALKAQEKSAVESIQDNLKNEQISAAKSKLVNLVNNTTRNNEKKWGFYQLGRILSKEQLYDSSIIYLTKAKIINRPDSLDGIIHQYLGLCNYNRKNYQEGLQSYEEALSLFKTNGNLREVANCHYNIAHAHIKMGNYQEALQNILINEEVLLEVGDQYSLLYTYNALGTIYKNLSDFKSANQYQIKGLRIAQELGNNSWISRYYNNLGLTSKKMNQFDSAVSYYKRSIALKSENNNSKSLSIGFTNLGEVYLLLGSYDSSEYYSKKALSIKEASDDKEGIAIVSNNLGWLYLLIGKNEQSFRYLKQAEKLAEQMNLLPVLKDNQELQSDLFIKTGQTDSALYYFQKMHQLQDSLINVEKVNSLTEMQIKYETAQREKDLLIAKEKSETDEKLLGQQRTINLILGVLVGLLVLAGFILLNQYKLKQKANLQINFLMRELHHRVKNNFALLSSILRLQSNEIEDKVAKQAMQDSSNRIKALLALHSKLHLDKDVLEIEMKEFLTNLVDQIQRAFTHSNNNKITILADKEKYLLDVDKAIPVALIINELITNNLKHASTETDQLSIAIRSDESNLFLDVTQNEVFQNSDTNKHLSFGMKMVDTLIKQLNADLETDTSNGLKNVIRIPNTRKLTVRYL